MSDALPAAVVAFIHQYVASVRQLEVLLLLHASAERDWTAADVSDALYAPRDVTVTHLEQLRASGLVEAKASRYRFAMTDSELDRTLTLVADLYGTHRHRIVAEIFTPSATPARAFAEAFRLRRPPKR